MEHLSDSSRPEGFTEKVDVLLPKASEIIKRTFGAAGKQTQKPGLVMFKPRTRTPLLEILQEKLG